MLAQWAREQLLISRSRAVLQVSLGLKIMDEGFHETMESVQLSNAEETPEKRVVHEARPPRAWRLKPLGQRAIALLFLVRHLDYRNRRGHCSRR
jgi:hypothetical protein